MKKNYLALVSLTSLTVASNAFAEEAASTSNFTPAQKEEIEKIIGEYISNHTDVVMDAVKAEGEKQKKEEAEKLQKAIIQHKEKIFKNPNVPVAGNPKGTKSLVIFADPYCGYCRKLHEELPAVLESNNDLKVLFVDVPIMGYDSVTSIKAMIAANNQEKYVPLQKLILTSKDHLTHKKLVKKAKSLGMDVKKFETDCKSKETQAQIDKTLELVQEIGIHGTPVILVNETTVSSGYLPADQLKEMLAVPVTPTE